MRSFLLAPLAAALLISGIDDDLLRGSTRGIRELALEKLATIVKGDLFQADFSRPHLITIYLLPTSMDKLQRLLEKTLRQGSRVVCHDYPFPGWNADKMIQMEDEEGRNHSLYLYRR